MDVRLPDSVRISQIPGSLLLPDDRVKIKKEGGIEERLFVAGHAAVKSA